MSTDWVVIAWMKVAAAVNPLSYLVGAERALLAGDLWRRGAAHANRMAQLLGSELSNVPKIKLTQPVESNGVFATIPREYIPALQEKYFFYVWDDAISEVRLMASFDTSEDDIHDFINFVNQIVQ